MKANSERRELQGDYDDAFLNSKRRLGDLPADTFITTAFLDMHTKQALHGHLEKMIYNKDISVLSMEYPAEDFIAAAGQLPVWADVRLMEAGSSFFVKHSENVLLLLGLLSLPYCYTASNGAMVLYLSERLKNDTSKRLNDTATFIWEVMAPGAFTGSGKGFTSILKIRLIHAAARYYTAKSGKWNSEWGMPVNQEDMAGTNLSFSLLVIRGLRKLGIAVSDLEQRSFLHLWNVIGALLAVNEDLLPGVAGLSAKLEKAIRLRQFKSSPHGIKLTSSLLTYIRSVNPNNAADKDIPGLMRYLLGKEVSDMLMVPQQELTSYQIGIIQFANSAKSLKPTGNVVRQYEENYHQYKMQQNLTKHP